MKLTKHAKEEFEKWYQSKEQDHYYEFLDEFNRLSNSMKFGVFLDWFDSVGVEIYFQCDETLIIFENHEPCDIPFRQFDTRNEAQTKAIELSSDLFNKRYESI